MLVKVIFMDAAAALNSRKVLHLFRIGGLRLLQGSDQHAPLAQADLLEKLLIEQLRDDVDAVILNGDLFDATRGEATQGAIGSILRAVARKYEGPIIYVPGNHCLRGAGGGAWGCFGTLPPNVHAPLNEPTQPLRLASRHGDIVVGNIFYDFDFLDPAILGLSKRDVTDFYPMLPDGKYLLEGTTGFFPQMASNTAKAITPDTKVLVTHCAPHPALVVFKIAETTEETLRVARKHDITFICTPNEDEERVNKKGLREQGITSGIYREMWNMKNFFMGSNVLSHPAAQPADGLIVFSGHTHRSEDRFTRQIAGRQITFCSFQFLWDEPQFMWANRSNRPYLGKAQLG
jgi:predicted phosphodiesterase